jgi:glycosidase
MRLVCTGLPALLLYIAAAPAPHLGAQPVGAPQIQKVEPPNWWIGHSINPVRIMVRGRNLAGARIDGNAEGVQFGFSGTNAAGTYLFADLRIDPRTTAGARRLRIVNSRGSAELPFEVLQPLPRAGRFQGFSADDLIYLIMPDRFSNGDPSNDDPPISKGLLNRQKSRYYHGGDLQGIINRLPYLKDLGISALWLNPVYDNANRLNEREKYDSQPITDYHSYGAVDFYAVDEHFGDIAKFKELVDSAHRAGMKIIQDQVANHTGPYHPWVDDPPTPTWYNGTEKNHLANTWQTWTLIDRYASPAMQRATLEGWFIDILPDLNQWDEEVSRYLIQNTLWWIGMTGLDGIRQDTLPYVPRAFWSKWMRAIKREYPGFRVVGEAWDDDPAWVSFFQGGRQHFDGVDSGIDALFDFPLAAAVRQVFAGNKPLRDIPAVLAKDYLYVDPGMLVTFLGLHDMPRFMNEPGVTPGGLRQACSLVLTTRGIPLIYYGDEIAMPGGPDPDNRRDFPGGWPDDPQNAFEASGRSPEQNATVDHVRTLAHLRRELAPLRKGTLLHLQASEQTYAYARVSGSDVAVVVLNQADRDTPVEVPVDATGLVDGTTLHNRLGAPLTVTVHKGTLILTLKPRSTVVLIPQ